MNMLSIIKAQKALSMEIQALLKAQISLPLYLLSLK